MDYSLFLIVLQVPRTEEARNSETMNIVYKDNEPKIHTIGDHSLSSSRVETLASEKKKQEDEVITTVDELIRHNRFVMYSPSHKYVYLMGLIDYLGRWNLNKKSELLGKTFLAHFIR